MGGSTYTVSFSHLLIFSPSDTMFEPIITIKDFFLGPLYLLGLVVFALYWRERRYKHAEIKKYFMPALYLRIAGAIASAAIYQYYYNGGDTFRFFRGAEDLYQLFLYNPVYGLAQLVSGDPVQQEILLSFLELDRPYLDDVIVTQKLAGFLCIFTFNTYMPVSLVFTFAAFAGSWRLFKTFYKLYPQLHRELAIACLFLPSLWFWGAGLLKDPLCMGALGYLSYAIYKIFIEKKKILISVVIAAFACLLLVSLKIYILMAYIPAIIGWLFLERRAKIRSPVGRAVATPFFLVFLTGFALASIVFVGRIDPSYAPENLLREATVKYKYNKRIAVRDGGSAYDLGEFEPTLQGAVKVFPKAVVLGLFRPFAWEGRKPIYVPAILENTFILLFTFYILLKTKLSRLGQIISEQPLVLFCLIFSVVFAFAIGISSGNFGSMVRYKIPLIPFYFTALFVLYHYRKKEIKKLL